MGTKNCDYCLPLPEAKKRHGNHTMNLMKNGKYRKRGSGTEGFCLVGRLPGGSAQAIIVCKNFMHVAIAYIKNGAVPLASPTVAEIAFA